MLFDAGTATAEASSPLLVAATALCGEHGGSELMAAVRQIMTMPRILQHFWQSPRRWSEQWSTPPEM